MDNLIKFPGSKPGGKTGSDDYPRDFLPHFLLPGELPDASEVLIDQRASFFMTAQAGSKAVAGERNHSSGDIDLGADDAHVWRVSFDQNAETIAKLATPPAQDERRSAMR